ncbi:hypothetical protein AURANDRAFT_36976 [Aureococcus anophagefferens]|uniref:Uncharacterized protein n=1 Tax=Aureococcus anophagefferens TaxID=44056 RepID=F0Y526_AURAN|nr:hypothetical protein AURANDRAFT_36976 [Aureococcus anophagefferens]EGB09871.1 hypothetical protein AURANDRAFT_36976 [Aureococcus anophagefferens]|eukprot:XP_009035900.1 hypothetical protein AURANDRAFT_36976 [Aureococcus anophagefferens]
MARWHMRAALAIVSCTVTLNTGTLGYLAPGQSSSMSTTPRARRGVRALKAATLPKVAEGDAKAESSPLRSVDVYATLPTMDLRLSDVTAGRPANSEAHTIDLARGPPIADPFALCRDELTPFSDNVKALVETENPVLSQAATMFFEQRHGKRFRPTIVALMAKALPVVHARDDAETCKAKQDRLGQITEMIHVASLIHDDVLDDADTRRGGDAIHKMYSNKVAVLSGDYLLARASVLLARLQHKQVVEVMAKALDSLLGKDGKQKKSEIAARDAKEMELYLRKSYYKTASLICDASKSCALLAGHDFDSATARAAEEYGYHLGLAFQIVDDVLDFVVDSDDLGKPAGADLSLGLATAPILYAAQDLPELRPLIDRRFKGDGDVTRAYETVRASRGLELSRKLAHFHAQRAVDAICRVAPDSEARDALISVCYIVLSRNK